MLNWETMRYVTSFGGRLSTLTIPSDGIASIALHLDVHSIRSLQATFRIQRNYIEPYTGRSASKHRPSWYVILFYERCAGD